MTNPTEINRNAADIRPDAVIPWPSDQLHSKQFPYLLAFLSEPLRSSVHAVSVIPINDMNPCQESLLIDAAELFYKLHSIPCCLVLNDHVCAWFLDNKGGIRSSDPPKGGFVVPQELFDDEEVRNFVNWCTSVHRKEYEDPFLFSPPKIEIKGERFDSWTNFDPIIDMTERNEARPDDLAKSVENDWGITANAGWKGDAATVIDAVRPLADLLDQWREIRIVRPGDLAEFASAAMANNCSSRLLLRNLEIISPFIRLYQQVDLYQPIEWAQSGFQARTELAMLMLQHLVSSIRSTPSLRELWEDHWKVFIPLSVCSAPNFWRLDLWTRVFSTLEDELDPLYSGIEPRRPIQEIKRIVNAARRAFIAGAGFFFDGGETLFVLPWPKLQLDSSDEFHCESGPAIIDLLGHVHYAWHGVPLEDRHIHSALLITNHEIATETSPEKRKALIECRAFARNRLVERNGALDPSFLFQSSPSKGGK